VYDLLRDGARLTREQVLDLVIQVAEGLDHAHRQHVVHRDVKPANLMLLEDGTVKITDFGIAKVATSDLTRTGQFLGTPNYMSPEQVIGHAIDGRSDLFSLGIILYELLTGEKPFMGSSLTTITYQIVNVDPIEPSRIQPAVPPALDAICRKLLRKSPDERFQTGRELAAALRGAKDGAPVEAQATPAPVTAPLSAPRPPSGGPSHAEAVQVRAPPAEGRGASGRTRRALAFGAVAVVALALAALVALRPDGSGGSAGGPSAGPLAAATSSPAAASAAGEPAVPVIAADAGGRAVADDQAPAGDRALAGVPARAAEPDVRVTPRVAAAPAGVAAAPAGAASTPRAQRPPAPPGAAGGRAPLLLSGTTIVASADPEPAPPGVSAGAVSRAAPVRLVLEHKLDSGTASVLVDGEALLAIPLRQDRRRGKTTQTASLEVPEGRHDVRLCVASPEIGAGELCNQVVGRAFAGGVAVTFRGEHFKTPLTPHKLRFDIE
jgi:hypothetical protein